MKFGFSILLIIISFLKLSAQDQKIADSLMVLYDKQNFQHDSLLAYVIQSISFNHSNVNEKLRFAELLISNGIKTNNNATIHSGYFLKGNALRLKGDLKKALDAYLESLNYAIKLNDFEKIGEVHLAIGDVYSINKNHRNSVLYYNRAIALLRNENDSIALATALLNAGDEYFISDHLDSALKYFEESGKIFSIKDSEVGKAYNLGNVGLVYAKLGNSALAESKISQSISTFEELGNLYPISVYLIYMSDIYWEKGDKSQSLTYAKRSLELAEKYGLKEQISDANLKLSEFYENLNQPILSLQHYKAHVAFRDSVNNIETVQQMADLRTNYEVSQKQIEVDLLNVQKRNQQIIVVATVIAMFLIGLLAFGLYRRSIFIQKTSRIIEKEKDRSEALLLNILPEETALELKEHGKIQAKKFDLVTVLFTDFKGFTKFAENVDPEHLVKSIDFYFKAFDEITTTYGLEKIKTIGDSYMCAGGLPTENQTHARDVIYAAREMIALVKKEFTANDDLIHFEVRIGVHTGPVVAGIVGIKKWQYDIWGDTVNIASRMESNSEPGMVNLSETTYNEINDEFLCEYRGEIKVKNRGLLKMYFLS